jgi:hypothetical protein
MNILENKIDLIFYKIIKSIIIMDSVPNTDMIVNDYEQFIVDMKNSNENMDEKMKEVAGDSEEILQILKTINNIVDCKNKQKNTN